MRVQNLATYDIFNGYVLTCLTQACTSPIFVPTKYRADPKRNPGIPKEIFQTVAQNTLWLFGQLLSDSSQRKLIPISAFIRQINQISDKPLTKQLSYYPFPEFQFIFNNTDDS